MRQKKVIPLALSACLVALFLVSCVSPEMKAVREMEIESVDLSRVPDGTYEGSFAYGSFSYVVSAQVENGRIVSVDILQNRTTKRALMAEGIVSRVLAEQRTDVDAVAGATTTSKALLKALENALARRG